jgi:hypothetical protein
MGSFVSDVSDLDTGWARVPLGGFTILAAGLVSVWAIFSSGTSSPVDSTALWIGSAGAALMFVSLFVPYDGFSSLADESGAFVAAPAVAIAAAAVALAMLGRRSSPTLASGMLLAIGVQSALHFFGLIIAAALAIGERGEVRAGGFLGLLGGLLVAVAGAYAYRATKPRVV